MEEPEERREAFASLVEINAFAKLFEEEPVESVKLVSDMYIPLSSEPTSSICEMRTLFLTAKSVQELPTLYKTLAEVAYHRESGMTPLRIHTMRIRVTLPEPTIWRNYYECELDTHSRHVDIHGHIPLPIYTKLFHYCEKYWTVSLDWHMNE